MRMPARDESGFAMVVSVVLMGMIATLGAVVMTSGNSSEISTGRSRSWIQSLHVAEAGANEAIIRLTSTSGAYTGTFTGTTEQGSFSVTVANLGRSRYRIDATGNVGTGAALREKRAIRVTMAPPPTFKAALFSYTSIDTKNNDHVVGDVWANQNVVVDAGDVIDGSVTAATGFLSIGNGAHVKKDVLTGGYNPADTNAIYIDQNARVDGNATASVTAPTDPTTCGGESTGNFTIRVRSGAVVGGNTKTWGSKTGPGVVNGTITNNVCIAAPAAKPMPGFTYNAANYDAATLHEWGTPSSPSATAASDAQTWLAANKVGLKGTLVVFQSGAIGQFNRLDLGGVKIAGDLTVVTNLPIYADGITEQLNASGAPVSSDSLVLLASTYKPPTATVCDVNHDNSECAVHMKNQFHTSGATAAMIYAPNGPVAVKNNAEHYGAVYADNIQIKNNQELTYDPRVERIVGFGPVTLEQAQWLELPA